jgi:hypothetical protein
MNFDIASFILGAMAGVVIFGLLLITLTRTTK